jgi:hypothetical protein
MTCSLDVVESGQVSDIAEEVFAAMVDGPAGSLASRPGGPRPESDPLHAWVELETEPASRVQLTTEATTAGDLTRAFLHLGGAAPVTEVEVVDALGEIANVFGGNIKALLPEHVSLTLPEVSRDSPSESGALRLLESVFSWRGHSLVISLWMI